MIHFRKESLLLLRFVVWCFSIFRGYNTQINVEMFHSCKDQRKIGENLIKSKYYKFLLFLLPFYFTRITFNYIHNPMHCHRDFVLDLVFVHLMPWIILLSWLVTIAGAMTVISDEKAAACAASRDNCVHRYQSNRYSDIGTTMFHFKYMFANNVYSSFTLAIHPAEGTHH